MSPPRSRPPPSTLRVASLLLVVASLAVSARAKPQLLDLEARPSVTSYSYRSDHAAPAQLVYVGVPQSSLAFTTNAAAGDINVSRPPILQTATGTAHHYVISHVQGVPSTTFRVHHSPPAAAFRAPALPFSALPPTTPAFSGKLVHHEPTAALPTAPYSTQIVHYEPSTLPIPHHKAEPIVQYEDSDDDGDGDGADEPQPAPEYESDTPSYDDHDDEGGESAEYDSPIGISRSIDADSDELAHYSHETFHHTDGSHGDDHGNFHKKKGSSWSEEHHHKSGDKGNKGYDHFHKHETGKKGHWDKKMSSGDHKEHGAKKKSHHDEASSYNKHHKEGHQQKGGKHGEKKYHKKGTKTTGYHNVYHKDEFKKDHKFYDVADHKGTFKKYGSGHKEHEHDAGHWKKGGQHHSAGEEAHHHKEGGFKKGHVDDQHKKWNKKKGHESHHNDHEDYSKKKGDEDENEHKYKVDHGEHENHRRRRK